MKFFLLQFVQFFLVVANTRAYTQGNYTWTALTDLLFSVIQFTILKKVAASKKESDVLWYALGGVAGSLTSIYVTKLIYGQ